MKKFQLILLAFLLIYSNNFAQLQSISFHADYSTTSSTRLQITEANAVGGGVKIKLLIAENLAVNVNGGYKLYSLSAPDVLNNWDWVFWTERYYPKIVSDLNADPNLSVDISAVQKMDLIPFSIGLNFDLPYSNKIVFSQSIGIGIYFYNRRMYAVENWSKYYPDADYTLTYEYRNFAPSKKGNPLFVNLGSELKYLFWDDFSLFTQININAVISTEGSMGYDSFPLKNEVSFVLGVAIFY
jgi:hypothetical protein